MSLSERASDRTLRARWQRVGCIATNQRLLNARAVLMANVFLEEAEPEIGGLPRVSPGMAWPRPS